MHEEGRHRILDYVIRRFFESQGVPREVATLVDAEVLAEMVRDSLREVAQRIEREWFSDTAPIPGSDPDPWWTKAERKLVVRIRDELWGEGLPLLQKAPWPDGKPFAAIISHDVDALHPMVEFSGAQWLVAHLAQASAVLTGHAPCARGASGPGRLNRAMGIAATFFFRTTECVGDKRLSRLLRYLRQLGFEIGLHASPECAKDDKALELELTRLRFLGGGRSVSGVRNHTLAFDPRLTWRIQANAGIEYDSSFAWNKVRGFRSGSALPFRGLDLETGYDLAVLELPLVYMDWTDLAAGEGGQAMKEHIAGLVHSTRELGGLVVMNFHSSYLSAWTHPHVRDAYIDACRLLQRSDGWIASAGQCSRWWKRRSEAPLSLARKGGKVIVGNRERIPMWLWWPDRPTPETIQDPLLRLGELRR